MTFPPVFNGIGALVVNCSLDPHALLAKLDPATSWVAVKRGGTDIAPAVETDHCVQVWKAAGLTVGTWVYCEGPPGRDLATALAGSWAPDFTIWDVEAPYKNDEGGDYDWAALLVSLAATTMRCAVTSYGGYKTSIDFGSFAKAGWPILAQVYDSFQPGDELTYGTARGGVYPISGIHQLRRTLALSPGQSVYRPEGIDR